MRPRKPGDDAITYVMPIKSAGVVSDSGFDEYVRWIAERAETIIVDGSDAEIFASHHASWGSVVTHVPPAPDLMTPMGKVGGVLTGVRLASNERIVIADDDVRYDAESLSRVGDALRRADVVRPQNYFASLPWHARWDTSRTLLNRLYGGDWPGTLGVRKSILQRTGGYDGEAMFENLELVRTVIAAGGCEALLLDAFVARKPSTTSHFWSQRVRQAFDEFARPQRLIAQLAIIPGAVALCVYFGWKPIAVIAVALIVLAEIGRRRANGTRVFPMNTAFFAPLWVTERAICIWLALGSKLLFGGVRYHGRVVRLAATPLRELRERFSPHSARPTPHREARSLSA